MSSQAIVGIVLVVVGVIASVVLVVTGHPESSVIANIIVAGVGILAHISWGRASDEVQRLNTEMMRMRTGIFAIDPKVGIINSSIPKN